MSVRVTDAKNFDDLSTAIQNASMKIGITGRKAVVTDTNGKVVDSFSLNQVVAQMGKICSKHQKGQAVDEVKFDQLLNKIRALHIEGKGEAKKSLPKKMYAAVIRTFSHIKGNLKNDLGVISKNPEAGKAQFLKHLQELAKATAPSGNAERDHGQVSDTASSSTQPPQSSEVVDLKSRVSPSKIQEKRANFDIGTHRTNEDTSTVSRQASAPAIVLPPSVKRVRRNLPEIGQPTKPRRAAKPEGTKPDKAAIDEQRQQRRATHRANQKAAKSGRGDIAPRAKQSSVKSAEPASTPKASSALPVAEGFSEELVSKKPVETKPRADRAPIVPSRPDSEVFTKVSNLIQQLKDELANATGENEKRILQTRIAGQESRLQTLYERMDDQKIKTHPDKTILTELEDQINFQRGLITENQEKLAKPGVGKSESEILTRQITEAEESIAKLQAEMENVKKTKHRLDQVFEGDKDSAPPFEGLRDNLFD